MSSALKSFILGMASHLEMTPAALYERQRALIRIGLLKSDGSRGPGGGLRATPESVSLLLISVMASESLSSVPAMTQELANLRAESDPSNLSISNIFAESVSEIIFSSFLLERLQRISVNRTDASASIHWVDGGRCFETVFSNNKQIRNRIKVTASLDRELLTKIASDLRFVGEEDEENVSD